MNTDAQSQRDEFLRQLSEQTGLPRVQSDDWGTLFELLAREVARGRRVVLLDEFKLIFSDTFGERSAIYRRIIASLLKGPASLNDILERTQRTKTGDYSDYLNDLVTAGFLARDYTWLLKTGEISKLSRYRLKVRNSPTRTRPSMPHKESAARWRMIWLTCRVTRHA